MKLPNDTQSTLTPTTHNDNTTGTTEWTHYEIVMAGIFIFIFGFIAISVAFVFYQTKYNKGQKKVMIFNDFRYVSS